jgi:hypothetical protein
MPDERRLARLTRSFENWVNGVAGRHGPNRRPFPIAMAISIGFHAGLLLALSLLVNTYAGHSISNTVLEFSLESTHSENDGGSRPDSSSERRVIDDRAPSHESATATASVDTTPHRDHQDEPAPRAESMEVGAQNGRDDRDVDLPRPDAPTAAETDFILAAATAGKTEAVEIAEPQERIDAEALVSRRQEAMLNRRLAKWSGNLPELEHGEARVTWRHNGQDYHAEFTRLPTEDDMAIERVLVQVSTEEDGTRYSTQMEMKRLSFSSYAQFVDRWSPNVAVHDDELDGRFHSNTQINLTYGRRVVPVFHGKVTTAARDINITPPMRSIDAMHKRRRLKRDEIFRGGLETGVPAVRLPKRFVPYPNEEAIPDEQIRYFDGDARITFYADGSYGWRELAGDSEERRATFFEDTGYLIAAERATLHIRGTVNGKVLVYSPECIVIEGDLVYAEDPLANPDADDYLGLVSDKSVEIAPPEVTGIGDLYIHAAIYAKGRFVVRKHGRGTDGVLYVYGSLTAESLAATEPRYATKIRFDPRLESLRPPRFPMTDRYEVVSWDRIWQVNPAEVSGPRHD